jgi:hypothetical protein
VSSAGGLGWRRRFLGDSEDLRVNFREERQSVMPKHKRDNFIVGGLIHKIKMQKSNLK